MRKSLIVSSAIASVLLSQSAVASEACYDLVDPVSVFQCLIKGDDTVVTPMGPGSGGTGGGNGSGTKPDSDG
ncbi:hypothetical protein GCM10027181_36080 [Rheinheimera gaetbuli]